MIAVAMSLDPRTKALDHMPTEGAKKLMWQQLAIELQKVRAVLGVRASCALDSGTPSVAHCCCATYRLPTHSSPDPFVSRPTTPAVLQAAQLLTPDTGSAGAGGASASGQPAAMRAVLDALGGPSMGSESGPTYAQRIKAMVSAENNLFHKRVDAITAGGKERAHLLEVRDRVAHCPVYRICL